MLSASTDPYYVARDEVTTGIRKLQDMHEEWRRLLHSENTAKSKRFQELHAEISGELKAMNFDLQDLEATINMVEANRDKFSIDDQEIASRKSFIKVTRGTIKDTSDSLTCGQTQQKLQADKREALMSQQNQSKAGEDRQSRIRRENDAFLDQQRQEQVQIIAQQDEALTELSKSTQRLGETARTINVELQDQQRMLEELDEDIDKETEKLNFVMKRMGRLLKTSDNKQLCAIIALSVLFLVLLFLVIQ